MTAVSPVQSGGRAAWFAARARNATRRGLLVAAVGGTAAVLTLLVLIIVPRQVNRAIRAQVEALPSPRDTVAVHALLASRNAAHDRAEQALRAAIRADSALVEFLASAAARSDSASTGAAPGANTVADNRQSDLSRDAEGADLQQRLNRARVAPLFESYRDLGQASLLRNNATVRSIVDSLDQVNREREAFAALGGPDARYAALSARMTALAQRLIRIAEAQLERASSASGESQPNGGDVTTVSMPRRNPEELQHLTGIAAEAQQEVQRAEQELSAARAWNTQLDEQRKQTLSKADIHIPPVALVVAALVIGVVTGYAVAFVVELRVPRIADAFEAERISGSRVIMHGRTTGDDRAYRARRRADRALPPVLEASGETYQLVHLTLTGLGEVARRVCVMGDSPSQSATVAANLAAAAAREARAVLLVDLDARNRLVAPLLRVADRRGMTEVLAGDAEVIEVLRDFAVGRDVYMTVLYGGKRELRETTSERRMVVHEDLERLASRYDLTVIVGDGSSMPGGALLPADDVVLCARIGSTPNAWLARSAQHVRAAGQRVRAVLSWAPSMAS